MEEETDNGETAALCPDDLKLQQVSFAYEKEKYVLKDVDILFAKGSKTAIIGRNGSGKTTIMQHCFRIHPQDMELCHFIGGWGILLQKNVCHMKLIV